MPKLKASLPETTARGLRSSWGDKLNEDLKKEADRKEKL
jgi:hypothetical protein